MHTDAYNFVRRTINSLQLRKSVLHSVVEFGGRDVNGSIRPLFSSAKSYISIDRLPGPGVDVIADAVTYTPPASVDCVVCCEVLEHAPRPEKIVENALRILSPGGFFIMTCATTGRHPHSAFSGGPLYQNEHYRNITAEEFENWLDGLLVNVYTEVNETAHDLYCLVEKL